MSNKPKRVTDKEIAEYFGNTTQTLRNYRYSEDERMNRRYSALREYCVKQREKKDETLN